MASVISSPAIRNDRDVTIPFIEMTATSAVPPPTSTIMTPRASATGRSAPMAAAMGSWISFASRAPALRAASMTAFISTWVMPDGIPTSTRGGEETCSRGLSDEVFKKLLGHREVCYDAVPQGTCHGNRLGRASCHLLGVISDSKHSAGLGIGRHDGRLADDDTLVLDVYNCVRSTKVYCQVF